MKCCVIILIGTLMVLMAAGTTAGETEKFTTFEDFDGGAFDGTELLKMEEDASIQLKALDGPHWDRIGGDIGERTNLGMAYDIEDDAIVVFGGFQYPEKTNFEGTWIFRRSVGEWVCMNPTESPSPRQSHSMVYDQANDVVVLFGGLDNEFYNYCDDTWTYDIAENTWTEIDTDVSPDGRYHASMAYDSINERVVLFGGFVRDGPYRLNDTWMLDVRNGTWTGVATPVAPAKRMGAAMSFDEAEGVIVLFGGYDNDYDNRDDTWEFNVSSLTWTEITTTTEPSIRQGARMVHIPSTSLSLLFGGTGTPSYPEGCWLYNSSDDSWTRIAVFGPPGRSYHGMVYDRNSGHAILFGGYGYQYYSDLWEFDVDTETWERVIDRDIPEPRVDHGLVYDAYNDRFILFGGYTPYNYLNDTWEYRIATKTWSWIETSNAPQARRDFGMVYDSSNDVVIMFGGQSRTSTYGGDTWEFNVTTDSWTKTSTSGPTARRCHAMAYDSNSDRTVLFGGSSSGVNYRTDTWEYDASSNSWGSGGTGPNGRQNHAMAYSEDITRVVLFGGHGSTGERDDTWEYNTGTNVWSSQSPSSKPAAMRSHAMAYDPVNKRVFLFGGYSNIRYNETWYYYNSGSTRYWTKASPRDHPSGRMGQAMAFDDLGTGVLFGGYYITYHDETWHLKGYSRQWCLIVPPTRVSRYGHDLMYHAGTGEVLTHGTWLGYENSVWSLDLDVGTWSLFDSMSSNDRPDPYRSQHCTIDPLTNQMIIFGGEYYDSGYREFNTTWLLELGTTYWDELTTPTAPRFRKYSSLEMDVAHGRAVLFGGYYYDSGNHYLNDTWTFDPATGAWVEASPSVSPSERYGHVMAYDPINQRVILHGGYCYDSGSFYYGDTWAYDLENDTWLELAEGPTLYHHAAAFDSTRGRFYVFGGVGQDRVTSDLWYYDVRTDEWTHVPLSYHPSFRYMTAMAYCTEDDELVMHGGYYNDGMDSYFFSDVWRLSLDAYRNRGTYTSEAIGPEESMVQWTSIAWHLEDEFAYGPVMAQVATDDDGFSGEFVGPDGTPDTFFTISDGEALVPGTQSRYLRYRLYLESSHSGRTPLIQNVVVMYETVTTPTVTLHSPNGGEDLMESGSHIVTWSADGDLNATPVQLHYSTDGGTSWTLAGSWMANTGHYNWSVPSVETATGLVRVSVTDVYGNTVSDVSDMTFAIDPPANWQLPGSGSGGGTGDGEGDDGPTTSGDSGGGTEGASDSTTLWIAVAAEGIAITVLTVFLVMVTANGYTRRKRRR